LQTPSRLVLQEQISAHAIVTSRDGKLELPTPSSQAGAWELAFTKSLNLRAMSRYALYLQGLFDALTAIRDVALLGCILGSRRDCNPPP